MSVTLKSLDIIMFKCTRYWERNIYKGVNTVHLGWMCLTVLVVDTHIRYNISTSDQYMIHHVLPCRQNYHTYI